MSDNMIVISNLSKEYRLGQIGGTTLREELQRKRAKRLGKEDPTRKIGAKEYTDGELFLALDDVSLVVKKGERVGIIGHNGAGKSTFLKLISRVTAPSRGTIGLNGRVTSMLEVGTGFHGELTGRENIYMNGAILGMTKKEIDSKIEEIIEFSEVRQFIDTPVKRYSSGMFVKLAFSVAAHLDSEIVIMDEVLAVGDVAFQQKCINKMNEISKNQGRTILYVSHNMNTIRQLCTRCIVLDHGHKIYDGSVDEAISYYLNSYGQSRTTLDLSETERPNSLMGKDIRILSFDFTQKKIAYRNDEAISCSLNVLYRRPFERLRMRFYVSYPGDGMIGTFDSSDYCVKEAGTYPLRLSFVPNILPIGKYDITLDVYSLDENGNHQTLDHPWEDIQFEILEDEKNSIRWNHNYMGHVRMGKIEIVNG